MVGNKNIDLAGYGGITRDQFMKESICSDSLSVFELIKSRESVPHIISRKETARMMLESCISTA